jgi:3-methyladenine DNA glycosylase AlkD
MGAPDSHCCHLLFHSGKRFGRYIKIAEILVHDDHDLVQKAVGSWVREAGKRDKQKLLIFLDKHAATMPRLPCDMPLKNWRKIKKISI